MKNNSFVFFSSNLMYFRQQQPIEVNFLDFWVIGWKFIKFFILYLKLQVSFSLSFASLFSVKRDNSSVFFYSNFILFWRKQPIKVPNFRLLISPVLHLDRLLLLKVFKTLAKKVQNSCIPWHWRLMYNLKTNWFAVSKMTWIWWILIRAIKSLKDLYFDWSLLWKIYNVWSKKVKRSYLSWH